jgi:ribosomal protein L37AE/L43A
MKHPTAICPVCQKNFKIRMQDFKKGYSKYCSKICFDIYQRRKRIQHICQQCGRTFIAGRTIPGIYCSLKCLFESQKIKKKNNRNPMWKGDNVGYGSLHEWIRKRKIKPNFCEYCKIRKAYDLANISQTYKRDINDYIWLCRSCHMKSDNRINNLKQFGGNKKCPETISLSALSVEQK